MKKLKKFLSASKFNVAMFALVTSLVLAATVGAASASIVYIAETYSGRVDMYDIGVTLIENGEQVSWRNYIPSSDGSWEEHIGTLLTKMADADDTVILGKTYDERLYVQNSGTIGEYVRVTILKYWEDSEGNKVQNLSPDFIDLHFLYGNGWLLDKDACTVERTILYYNRLLYPANDEGKPSATTLFADTLTISPKVATAVTQTVTIEDGQSVTTTTYDYEGMRFCIEVKVDAVQETNAQDAARSAWGANVIINPDAGTLTLQ